MNKKENRRRLIFSVIVVGLLIWVGSKVKDHLEFQQEMVQIVHSKEVEKIIEEELKELDPNALTPKGKIQSYEIDDETIEHNPMGGIMFRIIINGDKEITENFGLRKDSKDAPIEQVGVRKSIEFQDLVEKK